MKRDLSAYLPLFVELCDLVATGPHDPESDEGYREGTVRAILERAIR